MHIFKPSIYTMEIIPISLIKSHFCRETLLLSGDSALQWGQEDHLNLSTMLLTISFNFLSNNVHRLRRNNFLYRGRNHYMKNLEKLNLFKRISCIRVIDRLIIITNKKRKTQKYNFYLY